MSKKNNTKNIKVPKTTKSYVKNVNTNSSNNKKKSYFTILYTPMGLAIGFAYGFMINNPVKGILTGLIIGGGIDFLITGYKKKYDL